MMRTVKKLHLPANARQLRILHLLHHLLVVGILHRQLAGGGVKANKDVGIGVELGVVVVGLAIIVVGDVVNGGLVRH